MGWSLYVSFSIPRGNGERYMVYGLAYGRVVPKIPYMAGIKLTISKSNQPRRPYASSKMSI